MTSAEVVVRNDPAELGELTEKNVGQLKVLQSVIFPVRYNDRFYTNVVAASPDLSRLAFYGDAAVGAVCCREDTVEGKNIPNGKLYIMTLGVLSAYRRLGIGRQLLNYVLDEIIKKRPHIQQIYLHVHVNNDAAIEFYKQAGFEVSERLENYYSKLDPPDCFILTRSAKDKKIE